MAEDPCRPRSGLFLLGIALAAGLVASSWIVARSVERIKLSGQTIAVKGTAERHITSDLAIWRGTITTRAPELVGAYTRLQADMDKVRAWLEQGGVKKDSLEISAVQTNTLHRKTEKGEDTNTVEGFLLWQTVELKTSDVALAARISKESTALIRQDIEFRSDEPKYLYTKLNDLKIQLLGEASKDARVRAEQLASQGGGKVGALVGARQGVFQITPPHSTETSGEGENDTTSIEKSVKAVVTIEYSLP